jgi:hypothetical protein
MSLGSMRLRLHLATVPRRKNTALNAEMLKFERLIQRANPFEALESLVAAYARATY